MNPNDFDNLSDSTIRLTVFILVKFLPNDG